MSLQLKGITGTIGEIEPNTRAVRTTMRPPDVGGNGAFRLCAYSGLLTGVALGTASAGHIFAARWSHSTKLALITSFRAKWATISGFTAAQEVGLELFVTRGYTVAHSGGTAIVLTNNQFKKRASHNSTAFADMRIGSTGALTNGTHTIDGNPMGFGAFAELAAGAAVPKGSFALEVMPNDMGMHPLILSKDEGLILRNGPVLMGAGGTARVSVEMEWMEVDSY